VRDCYEKNLGIHLSGWVATRPNTSCLRVFSNSDEEEYRVLLPFIKDGFERGDKAIHVVSPDQHRDHLQRLAGIELTRSLSNETANSNFGAALKPTFKTVGSIKIACCSRSSRWRAAMPREDFP